MTYSADWRLTSRIGLKESYSDNIRLAGRGFEESDFVTEIDPGVTISARGARLQLQADYGFKYRLYASNSGANGHTQTLRSNGLLDVWDKKLYLQAAASIAQQDISTLGAQSGSDANINANRTEVRTANISPFWQSRLGTWGNLAARYTWTRSESDGAARILNTETQAITLGISSGLAFGDFGWAVNFSKQAVESSSGQFTRRDIESLSGTFRYRIAPTVFAFATIGRDENSFGNVQGSTGGDFYDLGLEWAPSPRTKISGSAGDRYFGNSYSFSGQHRTRLTTWNVNYAEQVVATAGVGSLPVAFDTTALINSLLLTSFPDPIERQAAVAAFIASNGLPPSLLSPVDFLTNQVSLSKRLQGSMGLRGTRGSLLLSVFRDNRSRQSTQTSILATDPFATSDTVIQTGYSGVLSWRFTDRTSAAMSLGTTKSRLTGFNREDDNTTFRVSLSHQLQPKVRGAVEYRWLDRDSSAAATVRENAITGTLGITF